MKNPGCGPGDYLAEYSVIVVSDKPLTPVEAAKKARALAAGTKHTLWRMTRLDNHEECGVDLYDDEIINWADHIEYLELTEEEDKAEQELLAEGEEKS